MFDGLLLFMVVTALALAAFAGVRGGRELVAEGFLGGVALLQCYGLLLVVSFVVAGYAEVLIPKEWIAGHLGPAAGARGLLLAAGAGVLTPAGPFVAMPIAAVMLRSGASQAAVVAFVSSWSLLAVHRFVAWEVPILGTRMALLRYGVCVALPLVAGLLARGVSR